MAEDKELKRELTLPMAIFIIIGMVIGASIWVYPAVYLSKAGPAIFLAYILAVIPGIFIAYLCAYLGSAITVAGGSYTVTSRLMGKFTGFMILWLIILAVSAALAALASMLGLFLAEILQIPDDALLGFVLIVGIVSLTTFYLINLLHVKISGLVEMIITIVGDILVMIIFIIVAIPHFNPGNFDPLFPLGFPPLLFATLVFFFSYTGFTLILDVAGEVKDPKRNIPRALLISIIVLVLLYSVQALMVAGIQRYDEPAGTVTEIILKRDILPPSLVAIMIILIALAIASTLHPIFLAFSRDFLMAGRDGLFPKKFGKVHKKYKTPIPSLTLLLIVSLIFLLTFIPLLGPIIGIATIAALLGAVTAVSVLICQITVCISALRLQKKFPELHENAGFKPSMKMLKIMSTLGIITSILFVLLLFTDPEAGLLISLIVFPFAGVGVIVYFVRMKILKKRGINIDEILKSFPKQISFE